MHGTTPSDDAFEKALPALPPLSDSLPLAPHPSSLQRGRTFSVNLGQNVCHCFDARCGLKGDVIDLWAALHKLPLRDAALHLVRTFALDPAPPHRTEKRNG